MILTDVQAATFDNSDIPPPRIMATAIREELPRKLIDQGKTPTEAAKIMGVSRATVYRALQRAAA